MESYLFVFLIGVQVGQWLTVWTVANFIQDFLMKIIAKLKKFRSSVPTSKNRRKGKK